MSPKVQETLTFLLKEAVREFYDDPVPDADEARDWMCSLREACQYLGMDWDETVFNNSTDYERSRMDHIIKDN